MAGRRSRSSRSWSTWPPRCRCWRRGIADGRGLAAALALGAAGALVGTRFLATAESLTVPAARKAVLDANGEQTERSSVLDIARGSHWPREYTGRTLAHPFLDR